MSQSLRLPSRISVIVGLLSALLAVPVCGLAQVLNGRVISAIYSWEKHDTIGVSETFGRWYTSVLLEVAGSDLSLHTHLQGVVNMQKQLDETPDFRAWYLYGRWKNIGGVMSLSAGRLPYFVGTGSGTLDGALTTFSIAQDAVRLTFFGGAPAPVNLSFNDWKPLHNNFVVGAQFVTTSLTGTRLGFSYVNKRRDREAYWGTRTDSLFNPVSVYVDPEPDRLHLASLDASYRLETVRLYGRADYNLNVERVDRILGGAKVDFAERWTASGEYLFRSPRLPYATWFSFVPAADIHEVEAGLDYRFTPSLSAFGRGALVQYDGDESFRYTFGLAHRYATLSMRGNSGYAGELTSLTLEGAYPILERMLIPHLSLSWSTYRLNAAADREELLAGVLGATVRPFPQISFDVQGQWLQNRVYENDVRLFAKANFWFTETLHLFE